MMIDRTAAASENSAMPPRPQRQPGGTLVDDDAPRHAGPIKPTVTRSGNTSQRMRPAGSQISHGQGRLQPVRAALESISNRGVGVEAAGDVEKMLDTDRLLSARLVVSRLLAAAVVTAACVAGRGPAGFLRRQADHLHRRRRRRRRLRPAGAHGGAASRQAHSRQSDRRGAEHAGRRQHGRHQFHVQHRAEGRHHHRADPARHAARPS